MISVETLEAPSVGAPPEPMQQHVVDRLVAGGVAERTLCGKPWDRAEIKPAGQICKACERRRDGAKKS